MESGYSSALYLYVDTILLDPYSKMYLKNCRPCQISLVLQKAAKTAALVHGVMGKFELEAVILLVHLMKLIGDVFFSTVTNTILTETVT